MTARITQTLDRARALMKGFTPGQLGVIGVAVVALVFGTVVFTRWVAQPSWTPLFSNLSGSDASAIVEQLKAENVQYQLADGGSTVLVPKAQVYDLRVSLSGKGLPTSAASGYSVLDEQGMTATDLQQNVAYQRALESELSRTLQAITGVQTALVHLAVPEKDVFSSTQDKTTASVLLSLSPGTELDRGQVRAITHLVGSSIPGLDPGDVTVTDGKGTLLSAAGAGADGAVSLAGDTDQQTSQFEDRMSRSAQAMLDKVLGPGNAVVRVNAQLDYDTRATTSERYVSETGVAPLSEATAHETYDAAAGGAGGVLGLTWPTAAATGAAGSDGSYDKQQRTVDNAVGKVVESAQAAPGGVQRLTVAVVLDSSTTGNVDPATVEQLVGNAVGLDSTRGDSVQVSSMAFDTTAAETTKKEIAAAESAARTAQYLDIGTKAGLILATLIVAMMLRRRRKKAGASVEVTASDLPQDPLLLGGQSLAQLTGQAVEQPALPASATQGTHESSIAEELELEAAVNRERLREEIAQLVDNQPDEVAQVIQGWLSHRKG